MFTNELIEKILDSYNAKKYYQSFIRQKNRKSGKQSEIITYQPRTFGNPNIADIASIIREHPNALHKLSKTIRQAKKVASNTSLHSDTNK